MQKFKEMSQKSPKDLQLLSKSMFILLKQNFVSWSQSDQLATHEQIYKNMIRDAVYSEDQNLLHLRLTEFDSITHHKLFQAIQKVFKIKGPRETKAKFNLTINDIKFPFSRNKQGFPPVTIAAESKSKSLLEISVSGLSAMIFVSFFLKPILNQFVKTISIAPTDPLKEENKDHESDKIAQSPRAETSKTTKEVTIGDVPQFDTDDDKLKTDKNDKRQFSDSEHEAEKGSKSNATNKVINDTRNKMEETKCYYCAMSHVADNVGNLLSDDKIEVQLNCVSKCRENCLDLLVGSISSLVVSTKINHASLESLIKNVEVVVSSTLDNTSYNRAEFYSKLFEKLDEVDLSKQPKIVTLSRELCEVLIGANPHSIAEAMKENKEARRNMIYFMENTGHYFSLQALVESWNIMHKKGVDIQLFLPSNLCSVVEMFPSSPDTSSTDYFLFMARITRQLITTCLKHTNIFIIEAEKIEFKHEGQSINKDGDMFIYVNKSDDVIYQMHMDNTTVNVEEIEFAKLQFFKEENVLTSQDWNFFLPSQLDSGIRLFFTEMSTMKDYNETNMEADGYKECIEDTDFSYTLCDNPDQNKPVTSKPSIPVGNRDYARTSKSLINHPVPSKSLNADNRNIEKEECSQNLKRKKQENSNSDSDKVELDDGTVTLKKESTIETDLVISKDQVMKYWNESARNFVKHLIGEDWPRSYGSPCAVVFSYCHAKKSKSAKRLSHFCKLVGSCKICNAKHICIIQKSPFEETIDEKNAIKYAVKEDLVIGVSVTGNFEVDDDNRPDIRKPIHDMNKATGLFLKGKQCERIAKKVSKDGVQNVFMQQFDNLDEHQMLYGNKTSTKSYNVLMTARQEFEKKQRCGNDFFESIQNVLDSQTADVSLNFDETASSKQLPGFIRSVQQKPLKVVMGNFDQLRIGANYLNKNETPIIFMDSSGKFLKKEKGTSTLLNTAVVIPPPAAGYAPFPIFEMISEKNKTIDFQTFLEYGWSYLSISINNQKVNNPQVAVSDFSFANIHAILAVFNKVNIKDYLQTLYRCALTSKETPYTTTLTICENHTLPNLLSFARKSHTDKTVADTLVAGVLKVFEAESFQSALQVFEKLARVHCLKSISKEARESIKVMVFQNDENTLCDFVGDFGDEVTDEENQRFGSRQGLRESSPYYHFFKKIIDKVMQNEEETEESNRFYAPKLMLAMTKQYLSLFPLFSASSLPNKKLMTNSHIELYWKDQRRILKDIPNRLR